MKGIYFTLFGREWGIRWVTDKETHDSAIWGVSHDIIFGGRIVYLGYVDLILGTTSYR